MSLRRLSETLFINEITWVPKWTISVRPVYTGPDKSWTEDFLPAQPVYAEPVQILWKMAVLFTVQKLARFHGSRVLQNADLCKFFLLKNLFGPQ